MGDRIDVQENQTKLPFTILLWAEQECHSNSNLGNANSTIATICNEKETKQSILLLQLCKFIAKALIYLR